MQHESVIFQRETDLTDFLVAQQTLQTRKESNLVQTIGSAGPTTSYRMDAYSPILIREGLTGMIGKGKRGPEVAAAMQAYGAVYFGAIGGCGALLSKCIKKAQVIAYEDLGAEAIRRLEVEDLPVVVIMDAQGNNLYETGRQNYLQQK